MPKPTPYPYLEVLRIIAENPGITNYQILPTAHDNPSLKAGSELKNNQQISKIVCDLRDSGRITTIAQAHGKTHVITEKGMELLKESGEDVQPVEVLEDTKELEPLVTGTGTSLAEALHQDQTTKPSKSIEAAFYEKLVTDIETYIETQLTQDKSKPLNIENKNIKLLTLKHLAELHNTDIAAILTDIINDLETA